MISDEERREVARRMRMLAAREHLSIPVLATTIECECSDDAHLWKRLADLIEPSCDREALLALAEELSGNILVVPAVYGTYQSGYVAACQDIARSIREACGEESA